MVARVHDHRVRNEQQIELATFRDTGDFLDDRKFHMAGGGALIAPSGAVVAGAKDENAHVHLSTGCAHAKSMLPALTIGRTLRRSGPAATRVESRRN